MLRQPPQSWLPWQLPSTGSLFQPRVGGGGPAGLGGYGFGLPQGRMAPLPQGQVPDPNADTGAEFGAPQWQPQYTIDPQYAGFLSYLFGNQQGRR